MFLVFIGQNATTGQPNRLTGKCSLWGHFRKFKTRKERDEFYDNFYSPNVGGKIWKCGKTSGRRFMLGSCIADYLRMLLDIPYTVKITEECPITGKITESWVVDL